MKIFLQTFCKECYALEVTKNLNFLTETRNYVKEAKMFVYWLHCPEVQHANIIWFLFYFQIYFSLKALF